MHLTVRECDICTGNYKYFKTSVYVYSESKTAYNHNGDITHHGIT